MDTNKIMKVGVLSSSQDGVVVDERGLSPTHTAGHGNCPKVLTGGDYMAIKENTKKGFKEAYEGDSVNLERPNSTTRRGRVGNGVAQTLTTACNQGVVTHDKMIRKLTPLECFRLMGFDDKDCIVLEENEISNAQLYKMAGNSIVVNVLMAIFSNLLGGG